MYHCCVHFYLLGDRSEIFEIIKEMPRLSILHMSFGKAAKWMRRWRLKQM